MQEMGLETRTGLGKECSKKYSNCAWPMGEKEGGLRSRIGL